MGYHWCEKHAHINKDHITFLSKNSPTSLGFKNERNFCPAAVPLSGSCAIKNLTAKKKKKKKKNLACIPGSRETVSRAQNFPSNRNVFVTYGGP